jgi:hypothetical protein
VPLGEEDAGNDEDEDEMDKKEEEEQRWMGRKIPIRRTHP